MEIQLGRIAHVLQWVNLTERLALGMHLDENRKEKLALEKEHHDLSLSVLFLRASGPDLVALRYLPDILETLGLPFSRFTLLYALGYEDLLRREGFIPEGEDSGSVRAMFKDLLRQGEEAAFDAIPTALHPGKLVLTSPLLGAKVIVQADDDVESQRLAERLLTACEALLATSLEADLFPYREELVVQIQRRKPDGKPPEVSQDGPSGLVSITFPKGMPDHKDHSQEWLYPALVAVLTGLAIVPDPPEYMKRVFENELALARAVNFTDSALSLSNVGGQQLRTSLADWDVTGQLRGYIPKRTKPFREEVSDEEPPKPKDNPMPGVEIFRRTC